MDELERSVEMLTQFAEGSHQPIQELKTLCALRTQRLERMKQQLEDELLQVASLLVKIEKLRQA